MNNEKKIGYALQTGEGKLIDFGETKMTAKVSGDVSEGTYSLIEMLHPPDVGLALHRYSDGQLSFWREWWESPGCLTARVGELFCRSGRHAESWGGQVGTGTGHCEKVRSRISRQSQALGTMTHLYPATHLCYLRSVSC